MNISEFVKERNEALLSLDKDKIIGFLKKHNMEIPRNKLVFWVGVHKSIVYIKTSTEEQKQRSRDWLIANGFKPTISFE